MSEIDYLEDTTVQILKVRFAKNKKRLKTKVGLSLELFREYVLNNPEGKDFHSPKGWKAIENAWYGRTPNLKLNELIDQYLFEVSETEFKNS